MPVPLSQSCARASMHIWRSALEPCLNKSRDLRQQVGGRFRAAPPVPRTYSRAALSHVGVSRRCMSCWTLVRRVCTGAFAHGAVAGPASPYTYTCKTSTLVSAPRSVHKLGCSLRTLAPPISGRGLSGKGLSGRGLSGTARTQSCRTRRRQTPPASPRHSTAQHSTYSRSVRSHMMTLSLHACAAGTRVHTCVWWYH